MNHKVKINHPMKYLSVFAALLLMGATGIESARADTLQVDSRGESFILGKGGSRMALTSHGNHGVVIVGKLGDRYVAMLGFNVNQPSELVGKLFLVDNVLAGQSDKEDAIGTCTWDGNQSSIIHIEGASLNNMVFIFNLWPRKYMQIFWFDMRERFGDAPDAWAVSCSCNTHTCYVFKYTEDYDKGSACVTKRTLTYKRTWTFGHRVKGIDLIDINSLIADADPSDIRLPPILVEVNRPGGSDGINGDFWCVASEIWFHNILSIDQCETFGRYTTNYSALQSYNPDKIVPVKSAYVPWSGICGGGTSALGLYQDSGEPTFAYHTFKSDAVYVTDRTSDILTYTYRWDMRAVKHTFQYDTTNNRFYNLASNNTGAAWGFNKTIRNDYKKARQDVKDMYQSCDSILFHCRGPRVSVNQNNNLNIMGRGLNGTYVRGAARGLFEGSYSYSGDAFLGYFQKGETNDRELLEKEEYKEGEKGQALRRCDEEGRQVLAIFLGYPPTAVQREQTKAGNTELFVNFKNVKTRGTETGSGVNAEWSAGAGIESTTGIYRFGFHAGYTGYLNKMIQEDSGATFSSEVVITKKFAELRELINNREKGTIFFKYNKPVLATGGLVWEKDRPATIRGYGAVIPFTAGIRPDPLGGGVTSNYFSLYDTGKTWSLDKQTYSAMTDGLENKSGKFNADKGNLFEFETEFELDTLIDRAKDYNYQIIQTLVDLANQNVPVNKDTFKDRPVKWLAPEDPGMNFGYGWTQDHFFQMKFSQFTNTNDAVQEGHGGYWNFYGILETKGSAVSQSLSRTYTNNTTENGFGFKTPQVGYPLTHNYSIRYWGFNVNPVAYKQMKMNEGENPPQRPAFIPKYCWERDQSFALFVPEVRGASPMMGGGGDSGCFIGAVAFPSSF